MGLKSNHRAGGGLRILAFLAVASAACLAACGGERGKTDLVAVTKPDVYLTALDMKKGEVKTGTISGRVTLSHDLHEKEGVACVTCHHKKHNDERIKKCAYCHRGVSGRKTMHLLCIECHEKDGGPIACDACHITGTYGKGADKSGVSRGVGKSEFDKKKHETHRAAGIECEKCHHKEANSKQVRKCSQCHAGKIGSKLFHGVCLRCHGERGAGPLKCMECHRNAER